jgi:hypothetical protein
MTKLSNPTPIFYDGTGNLLDGGKIYVGAANADPETQPIDLFWDFARTIPAAQPLRTIAGLVVNGATPANVFFAENDFSTRVTESDDVLVTYSPTTYSSVTPYQPLDTDLSAIAGQGTNPYGLSLLLLANQDALRSAAGTSNALQKSGGTLTGTIGRQASGLYIHWSDPTFTGETIYVTDSNGNDPTVAAGDLWFKLQ